jgi:predicted nucleotidyltransferase
MVNREIVEVVNKYLSELELKGLHISKAFIYGSQVHGTATSKSDIDLMLVSPQFDLEYEEYLPIIWFSMIRCDKHIEPYIVGEKRFLTVDISPIIGILKHEGFEIGAYILLENNSFQVINQVFH